MKRAQMDPVRDASREGGMDVPEGVLREEDGKLYVKREDGRWELFWPCSEAERRAGRRLQESGG